MSGVTQADLASRLGIHRSTISNIKNGKTANFGSSNDKIFENWFLYEEDKTEAEKRRKFKHLKKLIEGMGLSDATKDLDGDDYELFVTGLLQLARKSAQKSKKTHKGSDDTFIDPIKAESSNITISSSDIGGAQLAIPDECKQKCMFCRNWVCDMKYAPDDISEADGRCKRARGKDTKGSDGCEKFDPNLSAISEYLLYGIYPFSPSRLLCKTFSSIKR
jgi:transcriptional regulator with XRE-family HTH domain